jgi:D-lactate dehydrogenase
MKVVAYSIKPHEKEFLAKANQKKHDITLISNSLNLDTVGYAFGKDAIIVTINDLVSGKIIDTLAGLHIKYIVAQSQITTHINKEAANKYGIKLLNIPGWSFLLTNEALQDTAIQIIRNLDAFQEFEDTRLIHPR